MFFFSLEGMTETIQTIYQPLIMSCLHSSSDFDDKLAPHPVTLILFNMINCAC